MCAGSPVVEVAARNESVTGVIGAAGVGVDVADAIGCWVLDGFPPPTPLRLEFRLVARELVVGDSEPAHAHVETNRTPTIPQPTMAAARLVEPSKGARDLMLQPLAINKAISRMASTKKLVPGLPMDANIQSANSM